MIGLTSASVFSLVFLNASLTPSPHLFPQCLQLHHFPNLSTCLPIISCQETQAFDKFIFSAKVDELQSTMRWAMKIKEIKVFKSKDLVFAQFWSKSKNSTSGLSTTTRALFQIFFYTELVKYLYTYLRKTWRAGLGSLKFCVLSN